MFRLYIGIIAVFTFFSFPTEVNAAEFLTVDQIKADLTGKEFAFSTKRDPIFMTFNPGGKLDSIRDRRKKKRFDHGSWSVKDDGLLCWSFGTWGSGKERCYYLAYSGDKISLFRRDDRKISKRYFSEAR